jgi:hypothetical protein
VSPEHLLQAAYAHLEDIQGWHTQDPSVDVELAGTISHVLDRVVSEWETFSPVEQSWLRGMLRYFAQCNDRYHDFSDGGMRDDLEIVNACLRFVNRQDLLLPEDSEHEDSEHEDSKSEDSKSEDSKSEDSEPEDGEHERA